MVRRNLGVSLIVLCQTRGARADVGAGAASWGKLLVAGEGKQCWQACATPGGYWV